MNNENKSLNFSSNNLCSMNSSPSTNGATYKKELNEHKSKMHNLRTKCEKVKNTSMDGLLISIKLCKIKKSGKEG
jgi:hypothetical protein